MKRKLINERLPYGVFNRCITLVVGTLDEINRVLARECPDEFQPLHSSCTGHWKCYPHDGHEADYLCIVRSGSRASQLDVLVHESLHLVSHALRMAGLPHTEETEEAYTYFQQWVIRECRSRM